MGLDGRTDVDKGIRPVVSNPGEECARVICGGDNGVADDQDLGRVFVSGERLRGRNGSVDVKPFEAAARVLGVSGAVIVRLGMTGRNCSISVAYVMSGRASSFSNPGRFIVRILEDSGPSRMRGTMIEDVNTMKPVILS